MLQYIAVMRKLLTLLVITGMVSCSTTRNITVIPESDRALADTLLAYALDHEAVYSLLDTLKPISSVKLLRFPVAKDSTMEPGEAAIVKDVKHLEEIERYQRICRSLSSGDWQFILVPFNMNNGGNAAWKSMWCGKAASRPY